MPPHPPFRDVIKKYHVGVYSGDIKPDAVGVDTVRCFDGLVVKTSRCGRDDPGSNPGRGIKFFDHIRSHLVVIGQPTSLKELNLVRPFI